MRSSIQTLCVIFLLAQLASLVEARNVELVERGSSKERVCPVKGGWEGLAQLETRGLLPSALGPQDQVKGWLTCGRFLSQQGDPDRAITAFRSALQLEPTSAVAYRELGKVYLDKHEWKKATDAFQRSIRLQHEDSQTYYWLGRSLLAQRDVVGAELALEQALNGFPQEAETHSDLGLARMAQGKLGSAKEALHAAIQIQPDYAEAHALLEILQSNPEAVDVVQEAAATILNDKFRIQPF